jgi:hypothetical protein
VGYYIVVFDFDLVPLLARRLARIVARSLDDDEPLLMVPPLLIDPEPEPELIVPEVPVVPELGVWFIEPEVVLVPEVVPVLVPDVVPVLGVV